jgi:hypothetical protein
MSLEDFANFSAFFCAFLFILFLINSHDNTINTTMAVSLSNSSNEKFNAVVIKLFCSRHTEEAEKILAAHPNMS